LRRLKRAVKRAAALEGVERGARTVGRVSELVERVGRERDREEEAAGEREETLELEATKWSVEVQLSSSWTLIAGSGRTGGAADYAGASAEQNGAVVVEVSSFLSSTFPYFLADVALDEQVRRVQQTR
jgi:hypothetical protein